MWVKNENFGSNFQFDTRYKNITSYRVCPISSHWFNCIIVTWLFVVARSNLFELIVGEGSFTTTRSPVAICLQPWQNNIKTYCYMSPTIRRAVTCFSVILDFVSRATRASHNAVFDRTKICHQVLYQTWQVPSGNFWYDNNGIWWLFFIQTSKIFLWHKAVKRPRRSPCRTAINDHYWRKCSLTTEDWFTMSLYHMVQWSMPSST